MQVLPENPTFHFGHQRAETGGPVRAREAGFGGVDYAAQIEQAEGPDDRDHKSFVMLLHSGVP